MTEKEFAHTLSELTRSLAGVIRQGSAEIILPEDTCTAGEVTINATVSVCAQLIVESFRDEKHPEMIVCTDEIITDICALIAKRIIDASDFKAVVKKPKTK